MSRKLQVNERGSWRDVLSNVTSDREIQVMQAALQLHEAAGGTEFRLFDIKDQRAVAHLAGGCWEFRPVRGRNCQTKRPAFAL